MADRFRGNTEQTVLLNVLISSLCKLFNGTSHKWSQEEQDHPARFIGLQILPHLPFEELNKNHPWGVCDSVVECLLNMSEALDSIPITANNKEIENYPQPNTCLNQALI
jgi:hypothetical protein